MGRKALPTDQKREKPLRIRLSPPEREEIDQAAKAQGETSSEWARRTLLKNARKERGK